MIIKEITSNAFNKQEIINFLSQKTCLIGVFSKSCIHCINMKPQWDLLKKRLKQAKCNGILLEIDSTQLEAIGHGSLKNSIDGFPSIMVFNNGNKVKEYSGDRSSNDLFKFFKPYMVYAEKSRKKRVKKGKSAKTRNRRN